MVLRIQELVARIRCLGRRAQNSHPAPHGQCPLQPPQKLAVFREILDGIRSVKEADLDPPAPTLDRKGVQLRDRDTQALVARRQLLRRRECRQAVPGQTAAGCATTRRPRRSHPGRPHALAYPTPRVPDHVAEYQETLIHEARDIRKRRVCDGARETQQHLGQDVRSVSLQAMHLGKISVLQRQHDQISALRERRGLSQHEIEPQGAVQTGVDHISPRGPRDPIAIE